jgi:hypothetical protein
MKSQSKIFSIVATATLTLALLSAAPAVQAFVTIGVSINIAPPALPVYEQPPVPAPGYMWTPGYWAWGGPDAGYYWVPGTWVEAPQPGYLWTPGYWGWSNGVYLWNGGYWGPHIGFYGGVNYGFGYGGVGYVGGRWENGAFLYNGAYSNVRGNTQITNVYNTTVVNNTTVNHVSFNGGTGGIQAKPTPQELTAQNEQHLPPVAAQVQHEQGASKNTALRASVNQGHPPIAATARPAVFTGSGVIAAHGVVAPAHTLAAAPGHGTGTPPGHPAALPVGAGAPVGPHGTGGEGGAGALPPGAPAGGAAPAVKTLKGGPPPPREKHEEHGEGR